MQRRLAAILAADVVGYSALMAEDEAGTLEELRRMRAEVFNPAVAGHRGKIIKSMGDGWLVEFTAAVDAVNCAVRMQLGLDAYPKLRLRIGIHLGDITHEEEDIYGDGVNIAARLEGATDPGAIAISDAVFGTLDATLGPLFEDIGERTLKNIPRPVRIWLRRPQSPPPVSPGKAGTPAQRDGFPVVVAIAPVSTSDQRAEVIESAAGLTNDLFAYLDNGRWMTSLVTETPPEGAYVLAGTLRASGERLRLDVSVAQPNGSLIWSSRCDGTFDDLFGWQDEAGRQAATGAGTAVLEDIQGRLAQLDDEDRTAATCLLRGMIGPITGPEHAKTAFESIARAIQLDPDWALPYAWGALQITYLPPGGTDSAYALYADRFQEWYGRGIRAANGDALSELLLAAAINNRDPSLGNPLHAVMNLLRQRPYNQAALWMGSMISAVAGDPESTVAFAHKLLEHNVDPSLRPSTNTSLAIACIQLGRDREAISAARAAVAARPDAPLTLRVLAAALAIAGQLDEARRTCRRMLEIAPGMTIKGAIKAFRAPNAGTQRYIEALRLAGLPEGEE